MKLLSVGLSLLLGGCVVAYEVGEPDGAETDAPMCSDIETLCDGRCANLDVDPDHCGACGIVCDAGFACDRGECRDSCRNGRELCGRFCIDANLDPDHCGGCELPCGDTESCVDGECDVQ